jgi:hypothetical protein
MNYTNESGSALKAARAYATSTKIAISGSIRLQRWDEFCMAESATTINENGRRSASTQHRNEAPAAPARESPDTKNIVRTYRAGVRIAAILLMIFAYIKSQG